MSFRIISLPPEIQSPKTLQNKIMEVVENLYKQASFLRIFIQENHQINSILCKSIIKLNNDFEKRISKQIKSHALITAIHAFVGGINSIFVRMHQQVNNNLVSIRSRDRKIDMNRKDKIHQKMADCCRLLKNYIDQVQQYNDKSAHYEKKAEYFKDYDTNAIKFYFVDQAAQRYQKLKNQERQLHWLLQNNMKNLKQLQNNFLTLRVAIKEFYSTLQYNLNQYRKISTSIRQRFGNFVKIDIIWEEESEQMSVPGEQPLKESLRALPKQADIITVRKEKIKQQTLQAQLCSEFQQYLINLQEIFKKTEEQLAQLINKKEYTQFDILRDYLAPFLDQQMQQNRDLCLKQVHNFKEILLRVQITLKKVKLFESISNMRNVNKNSFISDTQKFSESRIKSYSQESFAQFNQLLQKFTQNSHQYNMRYRYYCLQALKQFTDEFQSRKLSIYQHPVTNTQGIFAKKYFGILLSEFFLRKQQRQFKQDQNVLNYLSYVNQRKLDQIQFDLNSNVNQQAKSNWLLGCCGLRANKKKDDALDKYNCALKDNLFLLQGKLKLYRNYFKFQSSFGFRTSLFNPTLIIVPKQDILQILNDQYIARMIVVKTKHGDLQFTSFINYPYDKLVNLYQPEISLMNERISEIQESYRNFQRAQMKDLQQKFKVDFIYYLKQKGILCRKVNPYLSRDGNQLGVKCEFISENPDEIFKDTLENVEIKFKKNPDENLIEYTFKFSEKVSPNHQNIIKQSTKALYPKDKMLIMQRDPSQVSLNRDLQFDLDTNNCSIVQKKFDDNRNYIGKRNERYNSIIEDSIMNYFPKSTKNISSMHRESNSCSSNQNQKFFKASNKSKLSRDREQNFRVFNSQPINDNIRSKGSMLYTLPQVSARQQKRSQSQLQRISSNYDESDKANKNIDEKQLKYLQQKRMQRLKLKIQQINQSPQHRISEKQFGTKTKTTMSQQSSFQLHRQRLKARSFIANDQVSNKEAVQKEIALSLRRKRQSQQLKAKNTRLTLIILLGLLVLFILLSHF